MTILASVDVDGFGRHVNIAVSTENIFSSALDAVAFKYAQGSYGADRQAIQLLGIPEADPRLPGPGDVLRVEVNGGFHAQLALFVGTVPLGHFEYAEIRTWAREAVAATRGSATTVQHLGMTTHGAGIGLDEEEAFTAQRAGLLDALRRREWPAMLTHITVFELDGRRAERLARVMRSSLPRKIEEQTRRQAAEAATTGIDSAGFGSRAKPHVFVAMQFGQDTDDLFHYGIQSAVKTAGFLCERIDSTAFTGDILAQIKTKIDSATFVVAELTGANPNVYLEVGYAWGRNIRTILLCKAPAELRFDVQGQKCLLYHSIRELEASLTSELQRLAPAV